jgi:hypothetical protein
LTILLLIVIYFHFENHVLQIVEVPAARPRVTLSAPKPKEKRVSVSVEQLARALTLRLQRIRRLQRAMEHANGGLRNTAAEGNAAHHPIPLLSTVKSAEAKPLATLSTPVRPKNWGQLLESKSLKEVTIDYLKAGGDKPIGSAQECGELG